VGGVVQSQKGPIIAVMHQYALLNKGHSIHSPCQFESYKVTVDDKSVRAGGSQRIQTPDGYTIPLTIKDGLARLAIRPYTDQEYETLPHVFLTAEDNWDPSALDHEFNPLKNGSTLLNVVILILQRTDLTMLEITVDASPYKRLLVRIVHTILTWIMTPIWSWNHLMRIHLIFLRTLHMTM
jgi:hypothetical protein